MAFRALIPNTVLVVQSGTYPDQDRGLPDGGSYFLRSTGYDRCRPQYSGVEPSEPFSIPVLVPLVPLTFGPSEEEPLLYATCAIYRLGASPSITSPLIYSWTSMLPLRVSSLGTSEVLWSCVDTLFPRGLGFCLILSPFGRRWVRFLLSPFELRDRRPVLASPALRCRWRHRRPPL